MKNKYLACLLAGTVLTFPGFATQSMTTEVVVSGTSSPLDLKAAPGDDRLFLAEQTGAIQIIEGGALRPTPFFDGTGLVAFGSFTGLRAFVFHPDYQNNGYVYIAYDEVVELAGDVVIARLTRSASDPSVVDPGSLVEILRVTQTEAWHGGGCMEFGPDGYFYVAFGDGYGHGFDPLCHAQDGSLLLGKMLRIDVDGGSPYAIPGDNPFVGDPSIRDEIWHLGLRHPWRWSFDPATGDMYIADVGQVVMEELDIVPAGVSGLNFGWKTLEGTNCIGTSGCLGSVRPCGDPAYTDPALTQATSVNCSIQGGYVYHGSAFPAEQGKYFFGGYCSGAVWTLEWDGVTVQNLVKRNSELGQNYTGLTAFGQDNAGEIYILRQNGEVRKIVPDCDPPVNYCSSNVNSSGNVATLSMTGTSQISSNDMVLVSQLASPNKPGIFFYGPNQIASPFGEGIRCVGGSIFRLQPPMLTDSLGGASRSIDFSVPPTGGGGAGDILPGSTWNFQFWFRDPPGGASGFNLSEGLSVYFCP
ncbi:MAG: glucose/arabinose dehydrogenase [Candidatus Paceibacteria bacterium]|jgi:glucose/arabinose dehydrogenase